MFKPASIHEIRKELMEADASELVKHCLELARYKKDNKEYLDFILFGSNDIPAYVNTIKNEVELILAEADPRKNPYFIKKTLRKILRIITKYSRYIGDDAVTADMLIYFCNSLMTSGIPVAKSKALTKLFRAQVLKIESLVESLHEDLRHDYQPGLEKIRLFQGSF